MSKEMLNALDALEAEKGISKEIVIDALEAALVSHTNVTMAKHKTSKWNLIRKKERSMSMR